MKTKPIRLRIEKPCEQNWFDMPLADRGRHCEKCSKQIIDFSSLADAELYKMLADGKTNCGRFENSQLNRPLCPYPETSLFARTWSLLAGLFFLSGTAMMRAQDTKTKPVTEIQEDSLKIVDKRNQNPAATKPLPFPGRFIVRGVIMDGITKKPIPFANVTVDQSNIEFSSDTSGVFRIEMPEDYKEDRIVLKVSYIAYQPKIIEVLRSKSTKPIVITLDASSNILGMFVIQKPKWWQFRKRYRYTQPR